MSVGFLFFETSAFDLFNSKIKGIEPALTAFTFLIGESKNYVSCTAVGNGRNKQH